MSVILDALRRSRKNTRSGDAPSAASSTSPRLPAGLGLGGSSSPAASGVRPARTRLLGLAALLVIGLGVWAAIQVARTLISTYAPPSQSTTSPVRPAPSAPAAHAPIPPPAQTTPTSPVPVGGVVASTAPPASNAERARGSRPQRPRAPSPEPRAETQKPQAASPAPTAQSPAPAATNAGDSVNHFELAVRYHNLGNYEEALKHYLAVLAADEFNVEARNNLGLLYHRRGLSAEAVDQFRRAIAINPRYVKARSNLAVVLMNTGRLAEARAELRAAAAIEPRNPDLVVNMALVEKADHHRDQAIELLVRAIGYQPTHGMAHYNVAVLYEEQGSLALAYDHYTEFLKYAGPEQAERLSDVQQRLLVLRPRIATAR